MIKEFFGFCEEKGCFNYGKVETTLTSKGKEIKKCWFCETHANNFLRISEAISKEKDMQYTKSH